MLHDTKQSNGKKSFELFLKCSYICSVTHKTDESWRI